MRTLTLGSIVKPATIHSSTSAGASNAVELAASMKCSLMILTVNSLVANMFSRVSLGRRGDKLKETLSNGGLCETYEELISLGRR